MNAELDLVGGKAEGQPGRVSHREGAVDLRCKRVEVWSKRGSRAGSVSDQEGDGSSFNDHHGDRKGEGAVGISEDPRVKVRESCRNQTRLVVFRGGRMRSVEPSVHCGERLGSRNFWDRVADGRDLCGSGGAHPLITLLGGDSSGGLRVGLLGLGQVGSR